VVWSRGPRGPGLPDSNSQVSRGEPGRLTLVRIQPNREEIAMNTTRQNRQNMGPASLGTLLGFLLAVACGGDATSPGATTQDAADGGLTEADEHAGHDHGANPSVTQLDTGYDLSKLNSTSTNTGAGQTADVARRGPRQTGLTPATVARKGGIGIDRDEQLFQFGSVRQGESRVHVFELISDGDEPLIISGIKPSCGCTQAEVSIVNADGEAVPYEKNTEIPVGARFQLLTEVATDGKPAGPFAAQVSIYSNAPASPLNLRLEAEIEPILVIEPSPTVYFGRMTTADEAGETVTISSKSGEPFKLTLVEETFAPFSSYLGIGPTAIDPEADGRAAKWEIEVAIGPDTPMGMRNCPVRFATDIPIAHPRYPNPDGSEQFHVAQINVQAQVTGMVHADPAFISFGLVRPGEVVERSLRIECHDDFQLSADMPASLQGLQGQEFMYSDAFSISVAPVEEGRLFELKLRIEGLPDEVNGSFGGILKVQVGHPWMDELTVRFSGVCRPGIPGGSGN